MARAYLTEYETEDLTTDTPAKQALALEARVAKRRLARLARSEATTACQPAGQAAHLGNECRSTSRYLARSLG